MNMALPPLCNVEFAQVSSLVFEQEYRVGRRDRKTRNSKGSVFVSQLALTPQSCLCISFPSSALTNVTLEAGNQSCMFGVFTS